MENKKYNLILNVYDTINSRRITGIAWEGERSQRCEQPSIVYIHMAAGYCDRNLYIMELFSVILHIYIYIHLLALLDMGTINGINIWRERRTVIVNWEKILSQGGSRCWQERWQKRSGVYYDRHVGCTLGTQVSTGYTVLIFFFSFLR